MSIERMDHVGVVVDDLQAGIDFFLALGLELDGESSVEGDWVDRVIGLQGVRSQIAMLVTPDGHSRVELSKFLEPGSVGDAEPPAANARGIRHLTFAVRGIEETLDRLAGKGFGLVGELETYKDVYRLCYVRGPEDIIVELAEKLS